MTDLINHPPHYTAHPSGVETIEITRQLNFNIGNSWKYVARAEHKGERESDLRKALWYVRDEIQRRAQDDYVAPAGRYNQRAYLLWMSKEHSPARRVYELLWASKAHGLEGLAQVADLLEAELAQWR